MKTQTLPLQSHHVMFQCFSTVTAAPVQSWLYCLYRLEQLWSTFKSPQTFVLHAFLTCSFSSVIWFLEIRFSYEINCRVSVGSEYLRSICAEWIIQSTVECGSQALCSIQPKFIYTKSRFTTLFYDDENGQSISCCNTMWSMLYIIWSVMYIHLTSGYSSSPCICSKMDFNHP